MKKYLLLIMSILALFSCNNTGKEQSAIQTVDGLTFRDTAIVATTRQSLESEEPVAVYYSAGVRDTVLSIDIEGVSAEGSIVEAHYILDSLKDATWQLFGETGRLDIEYVFRDSGLVYAHEKEFRYKGQNLTKVKSDKDILLKRETEYLIDTTGKPRMAVDKEAAVDAYSDFKKHVPLVLAKKP